MDSLQASQAIFDRWRRKWVSLAPTVKFSFDNDVKPEGPVFARVSIKSLTSQQYTIGPEGNRQFQRPGIIDVRLTGPVNQGRKQLDILASYVRKVYESRRIGVRAGEFGVTTYATSVSELKKDRESDKLWVLGVMTPFEYYEIG